MTIELKTEIQCEHVISNSTIMNSLNATQFDLVLADQSVMCGELIATKLNVPFVYNVRDNGFTSFIICG